MKKWILFVVAGGLVACAGFLPESWIKDAMATLVDQQSAVEALSKAFDLAAAAIGFLTVLFGLWTRKREQTPALQQVQGPVGRDVVQTGSGPVHQARFEAGRNIEVGGDIVHQKTVNTYTPPPGSPPALHQLPRPPTKFVGRGDELASLQRNIRRDGASLVGLQGQGGIGKTALALVMAHSIASDYPDAQIYLDLRGAHAKEALTREAALAHVVWSLHPDTKLPDDEAALRGIYHSLLASKRVLLLMDNARDGGQVEPLLPPPGSLLIVTSRQRFSVGGLPLTDIDVLLPSKAVELLQELAPMAGAHAATIAKACGYLPLALQLAAGALRAAGAPPPAEYADQLSAAHGAKRLELLRPLATEATPELVATFGLSYRLLDAHLQVAWPKLAIFPAPFDLAAAAAVLGQSGAVTRRTLQELAAHSLVDFDRDHQRFRLHDLLRDFANSLLPEATWDACRRSHATHYLRAMDAARRWKDTREQFAWFEREWLHIQAGQSWAASKRQTDKEAVKLCKDYPLFAIRFLSIRLPPREFLPWLEAGLDAARRLKLRKDEGSFLGNLGNAYHSLGEVKRAADHFEQSLAIARECKNPYLENSALGSLGIVSTSMDQIEKAADYYQQALVISQTLGDLKLEGEDLGNLGNLYMDLDEVPKAIEHYKRVLEIARQTGDQISESRSLGNLGTAYERQGETDQAVRHYEQAITLARELGSPRTEASACYNLATLLMRHGKPQRAVELMERALAIYQERESPDAEDARRMLAEWQR